MKIHILSQRTAEYRITPQVVACGREFAYTAKGLGIEAAFPANTVFRMQILPLEENATARFSDYVDEGSYDEIAISTDENGILRFALTLPREQIYTFRLMKENRERVVDFKVFCAAHDLWERTPMRGNTHCHSSFSVDGHEDPIVAASVYRKAGFDYLAITDHHKADGSVYAVEHIKGIPTEMALYYGEEVHVPNAYIHAVNVGALIDGMGLDAWYHAHEAEVNAQVDQIAAEAKDSLPADIEPHDYAWRKWIADTIHANGGIAIAAHPFWEYDANNTRNAMLRYIAETKLYDAAEIVFGQEDYTSVETNRGVVFWHEMRADGIVIPIVGVDDAHRRSFKWTYTCDFNEAYTILFAKDPSFDGFAEAIRNGYTTAVECYGDAPNHAVGTYRLAMYTQFLLQEYYPLHDELCFEEGCRIKDAYLGDEDSMRVLSLINGRVKRYTDAFFGR